MQNKEAMFSSKTDQWATPQAFFDALNNEFHFTLDPCADDKNHKCDKYFTEKENGLAQDWCGESVFCNPPYGREIGLWVKKAHDSVIHTHTHTHASSCCCRQGQIQNGFTITYISAGKCDSSAAESSLEIQEILHRFRLWS